MASTISRNLIDYFSINIINFRWLKILITIFKELKARIKREAEHFKMYIKRPWEIYEQKSFKSLKLSNNYSSNIVENYF